MTRPQLPARPDDDAGALIVLTDRLAALVEREIAALQERRPSALKEFEIEKSALALTYRRQLAAVKANPAAIKAADPKIRARLRESTRHFQMLVENSMRQVSARRAVSEGLVRAIGDEVARRNQPVNGYDRSAALRPVTTNWSVAKPPSLTLNQRV